MAISIDYNTYEIYIPQSYLDPLGGDLYELDVEQLRLDLIDWEDNEDGIFMPRTHNHNTESTVAGATYARSIEIISPYTIIFEDTGSPYTITCTGANHNISEVTNFSGSEICLVVNNAAGLIVKEVGTSGLTEEESAQLANISGDTDTIITTLDNLEVSGFEVGQKLTYKSSYLRRGSKEQIWELIRIS